MGARDLLADLADAGLTVRVDAGKLLVKPASKLTDDLLLKLRAAKSDLLALLAGAPCVDAAPVAAWLPRIAPPLAANDIIARRIGDDPAPREAFDERAAVLEFDAGRPRADAERIAASITKPVSAAALPARSCAGCTHLTRRKTCAEPAAAGLAESFSIRWPEPSRATTSKAFEPKAVTPAQDRPYRLTRTEADAAHAEQWDDATCARFAARVARFLRLGIHATDADDLAERLHLRDVRADDRYVCIECAHLAGHASTGWRRRSNRAACVGAELPASLVTTMQRCAAFRAAA